MARLLPTNTTIRLARVTAVYSRLRRNMSQADVLNGRTTQGYSDPWERCTVTA